MYGISLKHCSRHFFMVVGIFWERLIMSDEIKNKRRIFSLFYLLYRFPHNNIYIYIIYVAIELCSPNSQESRSKHYSVCLAGLKSLWAGISWWVVVWRPLL